MQETLVAGVRQRTGTLLAAHALVASFLGGATLGEGGGVDAWSWLALASLLAGVVVAAVILAPWPLVFALDARELYERLSDHRTSGAGAPGGWLAKAGYTYQAVSQRNARYVRRMSRLSAALAALPVIQTLAWLAGLD